MLFHSGPLSILCVCLHQAAEKTLCAACERVTGQCDSRECSIWSTLCMSASTAVETCRSMCKVVWHDDIKDSCMQFCFCVYCKFFLTNLLVKVLYFTWFWNIVVFIVRKFMLQWWHSRFRTANCTYCCHLEMYLYESVYTYTDNKKWTDLLCDASSVCE